MKKVISILLLVLILTGILIPNIATVAFAEEKITLVWPVPAHRSPSQNYHSGCAIDIGGDAASGGATVISATSGKVTKIFDCAEQHYNKEIGNNGNDCDGFGTGVVIQGPDKRFYGYAHLRAGSIPSNVYEGAEVVAGQEIGKIGTTGNSSGNHLHFQITVDTYYNKNSKIDPMNEPYVYYDEAGSGTVIPIVPDAPTSGTCGDNLEWDFNENFGWLIISGNGPMEDYYFESAPWNALSENITYIIINDGVTTIGDFAFYQLSNVTNVKFCTTLTSIGNYAFSDCRKIQTMHIPEGVTFVDYRAFDDCEKLWSVSLPSTLTEVSETAFDGCSAILGFQVDENNPNYCADNNILFNKDKTELLRYTTGNNSKTYVVPKGVKRIGETAFDHAENLRYVEISEGVTEIADSAFGNWVDLETLILPESLEYIGSYAFNQYNYNSEKGYFTTRVFYNSTLEDWLNKVEEDGLGSGVLKYVKEFYLNGELLTDLVIPEDVFTIRVNAFNGYKGLQSIDFGERDVNNTLYVGQAAFYGCSGLISIDIPNYVGVDDYAFSYCDNLYDITLPDYVSDVAEYYCTSEYSDYWEEVQVGFYCDSSAFRETAYSNNPDNWENGVLYIGEYLVAVDENAGFEKLTVKEGTKQILSRLTLNSQNGLQINLKELVVPEGVQSIGDYAFSGCKQLEKVEISDTVRYIGAYAFEECSKIKKIDLPVAMFEQPVKTPPEIESGCFEGCSSLEEISIPGNRVYITSNAFYKCTSLAKIYYNGSESDWDNYVFVSDGYRVYPDGTSESLTKDFYEAEVIFNTTGDEQEKNIFQIIWERIVAFFNMLISLFRFD